jgi:hypothetical protein
MNDPSHIVGADVVAPHQELNDGIVQHLLECWFGIHGIHDVFPCRLAVWASLRDTRSIQGTLAETHARPLVPGPDDIT